MKLSTPQFDNKGLSEAFLISEALEYLPDNKKIIKISGRYLINKNFDTKPSSQFICKKNGENAISTRSYIVENKETFKKAITLTINLFLSYNSRILGPRSLIRIIKNSIVPQIQSFHVTIMLEVVFWYVLKTNFTYQLVDELNITGIQANTDDDKPKSIQE